MTLAVIGIGIVAIILTITLTIDWWHDRQEQRQWDRVDKAASHASRMWALTEHERLTRSVDESRRRHPSSRPDDDERSVFE